jgi:hypothetical protein
MRNNGIINNAVVRSYNYYKTVDIVEQVILAYAYVLFTTVKRGDSFAEVIA